MHTLYPHHLERRFWDFTPKQLKKTLLKLRSRAQRGENSIFTPCLESTEKLKLLEGTTFYSVLVYSPLSELSRREVQRTLTRQRKPSVQQSRRTEILHSYTRLYIPVTNDNEPFIDTLSYEDVNEFVLESKRRGSYPELDQTLQDAANYFGLHQKKIVKIAPKVAPDLFIDTSKKTPEECARIIVEKIYPPNKTVIQ